jgi:predicted NodU family carbamoyl transferase
MKDVVNVKIKFREPVRPFAPSVLAERTEEYFVLPDAAKHYPGRFMLYVVDVRKRSATSSRCHARGWHRAVANGSPEVARAITA